MGEFSESFCKFLEEKLANIEKETEATKDTVRSLNLRTEEHGRRCELVANRMKDLGTGMETLNETVDCLADGLMDLPKLIGAPNRSELDRSSTLINAYVTEFQSIFNEHVNRALRKPLDQSPSGSSITDGRCDISDLEEKARNSVRRRLGLNKEELQHLESFTIISSSPSAIGMEEPLDLNNNDPIPVITDKSSIMDTSDQDVMNLLGDLSTEDHDLSHSIRVAIATVHATQSSVRTDDAALEMNSL